MMGCNQIQVESDSQEIIEACNGGGRWWSNEMIFFKIALEVSLLKYKHCPREANKLDYELASFFYFVIAFLEIGIMSL
jgi:hypothetical protein